MLREKPGKGRVLLTPESVQETNPSSKRRLKAVSKKKATRRVIKAPLEMAQRELAMNLKPSSTAAAPDKPHTRLQWRPC